jgi:hypothetical protein
LSDMALEFFTAGKMCAHIEQALRRAETTKAPLVRAAPTRKRDEENRGRAQGPATAKQVAG